MLNVLQLIDSFNQGGSERQAVQLARLLVESGRCRVLVACLDRSGPLRVEAERLHLGEIEEYPLTSFYDSNYVRQLHRFVNFLRRRKIAVVQTHNFYTNVFGITGAALACVPARIAARRETSGMHTRAQKFVERSAYRMAHAIVANCEEVRRHLIKEGVRAEKVVTVHNGLDFKRVDPGPSFMRDETLARFNLPPETGRRFVTIVANLRHEIKDIETFLRAAQRVHAIVPEAAFVIAGEGHLVADLRAFARRLGLERDVFFIGRCDRVAELLAVSSVCVLSSKAEGFSNSILEYMAAARPVVATNVGGAGEAILDGETGYLVPPGDDSAMAQRITDLLCHPERARAMGALGRHVIEKKFSCRAQLERTLDLYDRVLATHARPTLSRDIESIHSESM